MSDGELRSKHTKEELENATMNAAKMAEITLDEVLQEETPEEVIAYELSHATVDAQRKASQILQHDTGRTMSRVLFVTKDPAYLDRESRAMGVLLSLAAYFDEIHIMVLLPLGAREKVERIVDNVWVYRATAQFWWWLPVAALQKAKEQLAFSDGFRPDIVVGLDPFEAGLAAINIGKHFDRPAQVHVNADFTSSAFLAESPANKWRARMASYVLRRARSVRAATSTLHDVIEKKVRKHCDLSILPQFHNFGSLMRAKPAFNVHEKYKDFVFIMLVFGKFTADSSLHDVFSAVNDLLHNPRIGLIIVGDGPARGLFEKKAELLGIKKSVVFLSKADDIVSYLKTADVLVETSTSHESEETVLRAAASGLPLVMYATELRNELFKDGESASICEPGDVHTLSRNITAFLNHQSLRVQYKDAAQHIVRTRLSEDEPTFFRAFRDSIEVALVHELPETAPAEKSSEKAQVPAAQPAVAQESPDESGVVMKYPEQ